MVRLLLLLVCGLVLERSRAQSTSQYGQYAASLPYNFRALALSLTGDTRRFNTSIKIQVGSTYAQVGEYAQARRYLLVALQTSRHYDFPDRLNLVLGALGDVSRQQQQWAAATTAKGLS